MALSNKMRGIQVIFVATVAILFMEITVSANELNVTYDPPWIEKLFVDHELNVTVSLRSDLGLQIADEDVSLMPEPASVLDAFFLSNSWNCENSICNRTFKVTGRFLGFGRIFIFENSTTGSGFGNSSQWKKLTPPLEVTVLRQDTILNKLFTIFVATVVTINYINFGCALEVDVVKKVLKRPIAPAVGSFCQFVIMPLVSYGAGYLLFTDPVLRLGLFTFGCSPGGGASNMWTVLLGGNLNLSITMTFVSTIAAFATIPLWLFTLGSTILKDTDIVIPYTNIMTSLVAFVIPIAIGLLIQRFLPKVAARSKKLLAPICIILLIGIIVMASVANTYIFYMLSWSMVIAASISVWTGFIAGLLVSKAFRFPSADVIAVSIETGIQNTGIAFVLLSYSLHPPVSDMASVVPIAGSIITPIPLFILYCYKKIYSCYFKSEKMELKTINSKKDEYHSTTRIFDTNEQQDNELEDIGRSK